MGTLIGTPPNTILKGFMAEALRRSGELRPMDAPRRAARSASLFRRVDLILTRASFQVEDAGKVPGVREALAAERSKLGPDDLPGAGRRGCVSPGGDLAAFPVKLGKPRFPR